jgi:hypothetical protein
MTKKISKTLTLYDRDEKGELLPKEVEVVILDDEMEEYRGSYITITPMIRGEIKKLYSNMADKKEEELDDSIILEHCKDPSYTMAEIKHLKPQFSSMLVNTIMKESGLKVDIPKKEAIKDKEDLFAKN